MSTTSDENKETDSSSSVYHLIAKLVAGPMDEEKTEVIGKITFGNEEVKLAVASSPLIPLMISHYTDNPSPVFVKSLRACVVNCVPARSKCREKPLYETLIRQIESDPNGIITTLCAVCMNDEPNTQLLKEVLSETDTILRKHVGDDKELGKRVDFLEALML
jgi:hypothetical protein